MIWRHSGYLLLISGDQPEDDASAFECTESRTDKYNKAHLESL